MTRQLLPFPGPTRPPVLDPAFAALPLLRRLVAAVPPAAGFADACRRLARAADRRASPPAVFFHHPTPRQPRLGVIDRFGPQVARAKPKLAAAWADLSDLCADAVSLAWGDVRVRRAARAVPGLVAAVSGLTDHPGCRKLASALAVADDFPLTVLFPNRGRGWRLLLTGVADLHQLHGLLADILGPGLEPADADGLTAARYQFVRPSGLRPDGTLPAGLAGVDDWLWGHEHPADIPAVAGERLLLVTDAPYPRAIPALTETAVSARLEVIEELSADRVAALGVRPPVRRAA